MLSSALPLNIELGTETKTSWIYHQALGLFSIGMLLLPFTVIVITYLWVLLFAIYETLWGMLE
jgi:hypothetical protein